jgi:CheY-like chemotaxis protein
MYSSRSKLGMLKEFSYQAGQLCDLLEDLQRKNTSGYLYIDTVVNPAPKVRSRVMVLKNGEIVYGGLKMLNNQEFARKIGTNFSQSWVETAIRYTAQKLKNPSSYRELLEQIVRIRVFKWEQIETAVYAQVVQVIEQALPLPGRLKLDSTQQCDLCYGKDGHGLNMYKIIQDMTNRQQEWAALAPLIPCMEAIPQLVSSGQRAIIDANVPQHLYKWVDGKRSLVDIAEQLDDDPLSLARSYKMLAESGWLSFKENVPVIPEVQAVEKPRLKLLSVDDSQLVQILMKRVLGESYQVLVASNAVDALSIMNTNPIALLLLDVTMPDIDGLEFCRTVRSIPKFKELPIIMVTARDKFSDKLRGQIAGTTDYLIKPFEPEQLVAMVQQYVGEKVQNFKSSSNKQAAVRGFRHNVVSC